jgi:hypothetical protein
VHQGVVVAVGAVDGDAERHAVGVGQQRALDPALAAIGRVGLRKTSRCEFSSAYSTRQPVRNTKNIASWSSTRGLWQSSGWIGRGGNNGRDML